MRFNPHCSCKLVSYCPLAFLVTLGCVSRPETLSTYPEPARRSDGCYIVFKILLTSSRNSANLTSIASPWPPTAPITQISYSKSVDQDRLCLPCFSRLLPYDSPPVSVACTYTCIYSLVFFIDQSTHESVRQICLCFHCSYYFGHVLQL